MHLTPKWSRFYLSLMYPIYILIYPAANFLPIKQHMHMLK